MDSLTRYRRWSIASVLAAILLVVAAIAAIDDGDEEAVGASAGPSTTATTSSTSTRPERTPTSAAPSPTTGSTTSDAAPPTTVAPTTPPPVTDAASSAPTTAPAPTTATTTMPPPQYRSSISAVTAEQLGSSYTPGMGCAEPAELRAVDVTHWGYDGAVHHGRLIVHQGQAANVAAIFGDLYTVGFPIQRIVPVDAYDADDQVSMRDNNTSAYNCRTVADTSTLSNHAFGKAVDVNPLYNPYVKGSTVDPPEGRPWADRSRQDPGMIHADDAVVGAFAARGWSWGGSWSNPDYQHFDV